MSKELIKRIGKKIIITGSNGGETSIDVSDISRIPSFVAEKSEKLKALKKRADSAQKAAEKAKKRAEEAKELSAGLGKKKAAIEALQEAEVANANAVSEMAEAAQFNQEYITFLTQFTSTLCALGLMGIAVNRTISRELKMTLEGCSKDELDEMAQQELMRVLQQLQAQRDIYDSLERTGEDVKKNTISINRIDEEIEQIEQAVEHQETEIAEHDRVLAEQAEKDAEHDRALAEQAEKDIEHDRALAEQAEKDIEHDRALAEQVEKDAEHDKALAEQAEKDIEHDRALAKQVEKDAEHDRALAEQAEKDAEHDRVFAEHESGLNTFRDELQRIEGEYKTKNRRNLILIAVLFLIILCLILAVVFNLDDLIFNKAVIAAGPFISFVSGFFIHR